MKTYFFEGLDKAGVNVKKEVDARDPDDALDKIRASGYFPTKIIEKPSIVKQVDGVAIGVSGGHSIWPLVFSVLAGIVIGVILLLTYIVLSSR